MPPLHNTHSAFDPAVAARRLARVDPALGRVIRAVGPCTIAPRRDYFLSLARAIFGQQISGSIARLLFGRYRDLFPRRVPTPAGTLALTDAQLQAVGLSRQKRAYLRDLAQHFADCRIPTRRRRGMSDDDVIAALTEVEGIGRWTAEMFLMFTLCRPDVFPIDDLGIQRGVQRLRGLTALPRPREMMPYGELWRPYRSVASWYLWRGGAVLPPVLE
jgi:DNA-3-methyladenine glycosylase II